MFSNLRLTLVVSAQSGAEQSQGDKLVNARAKPRPSGFSGLFADRFALTRRAASAPYQQKILQARGRKELIRGAFTVLLAL